MPAPEAYRDGRVMVAQHDDLVPFMETYAYLMNSDILRGTMLLESPLLNYHASQGGSFFEMPNGPSIPDSTAWPAIEISRTGARSFASGGRRSSSTRNGNASRRNSR